ncbi:hypothetical protein [Polyangium sorediatum]|uniref:PEGA domain-containing protein n=1 Tax=Polyangium sorediatum TaxID=889274 RepID=A0ABT6NQY7_9BACT|nr:hypothetical protein [Polyangium sorediatum]MDI1430750.1 hypothetical protein [Polyangium sorediatum]
MRSLVVVAIALVGIASSAAADEPRAAPPVPPDALADAATHATFAAHVIDGDDARAAGRKTAAARSYAAALAVRHDPLIAGRLGVLLVELGRPVDAADLLLDAIQRASSASSDERQGFLKAYDAARAEVAWIDVTISHVGAKLTLDSEPRNKSGFSALSMFVTPGEHELRATLDGYEPAVVIFTARKGEQRTITLTLRELPKPLPPPERLLRRRDVDRAYTVEEPREDESARREPIVGGVAGQEKKPGLRGTIGAGPVVVFGVASWSPAVGGVLAGSLRTNEHVSIGVEGRAAWLTSGVQDGQINAMTAGGLLNACGHYRWFYGCLVGHIGVINIEFEGTGYKERSLSFMQPGVGGRIGARLSLGSSFSLQAAAEAIGLARGTKLMVGQTVLIDQPPVMITSQLLTGWDF